MVWAFAWVFQLVSFDKVHINLIEDFCLLTVIVLFTLTGKLSMQTLNVILHSFKGTTRKNSGVVTVSCWCCE